jgi:hypothetical protein
MRDICFGFCLGGGGPSPALTGPRRTKDGLTSPGAFDLLESAWRHGLPVVQPLDEVERPAPTASMC